jgi:hypothetical protein
MQKLPQTTTGRGDSQATVMCQQVMQTVFQGGTAYRNARHSVVTRLTTILVSGDVADAIGDVARVVDELVTNAVNAGAADVAVAVVIHHDRVWLSVHDSAGGVPQLRYAEPGDTHGRGLAIVELLSRAWGTSPSIAGKQVWAEITLQPSATTRIACTHSTDLAAS